MEEDPADEFGVDSSGADQDQGEELAGAGLEDVVAIGRESASDIEWQQAAWGTVGVRCLCL